MRNGFVCEGVFFCHISDKLLACSRGVTLIYLINADSVRCPVIFRIDAQKRLSLQRKSETSIKKIKPRYRERGFILTIPKPLTFST